MITQEQIDYAEKIGLQIYNKRLSIPDKFVNGRELEADIKGFLAEVVICDCFSYPRPKLELNLDKFDIIIKGYKIDIKNSSKFIIDYKQYHKKNSYIDYYLFCHFKGEFCEKEFMSNKGKEKAMLLNSGIVEIDGIIKPQDVAKEKIIKKEYSFYDKSQGKTITKSENSYYQINPKHLKDLREILPYFE